MRPTNKILLTFIILLLLMVALNKAIVRNKIELAPYWSGKVIVKKMNYKPVSSFDISGLYEVNIIRSDSSYFRMEGAAEILQDYTHYGENKGRLLISPKAEVNDNVSRNQFWIYTPCIDSLFVSNNAIVTLVNFSEKEINIVARDSVVVMSKYCTFTSAKLTGRNKALFFIDKVKDAWVNLTGFSNASVKVDGGEISGKVDRNSEWLLEGNVKNNSILKNLQ